MAVTLPLSEVVSELQIMLKGKAQLQVGRFAS
jgi:hypothetical protein